MLQQEAPVTGPKATAAPDTADHTPMALARSVGSRNTSMTTARVPGNTNAAPTPIKPRAVMSSPVELEKAAQAEKMPNNTMPICIMRSRPKRSPRPPQANNRPAKTNA